MCITNTYIRSCDIENGEGKYIHSVEGIESSYASAAIIFKRKA
jgi:hypothetical protein